MADYQHCTDSIQGSWPIQQPYVGDVPYRPTPWYPNIITPTTTPVTTPKEALIIMPDTDMPKIEQRIAIPRDEYDDLQKLAARYETLVALYETLTDSTEELSAAIIALLDAWQR